MRVICCLRVVPIASLRTLRSSMDPSTCSDVLNFNNMFSKIYPAFLISTTSSTKSTRHSQFRTRIPTSAPEFESRLPRPLSQEHSCLFIRPERERYLSKKSGSFEQLLFFARPRPSLIRCSLLIDNLKSSAHHRFIKMSYRCKTADT